jgi:hypothetical protein
MLDAIYGNVKPLDIMAEDIDIASPGRLVSRQIQI